MDIAEEIDGLRADRDDIRAAIVGKGGTLPPGSPMSDYTAAIDALPSPPEPVNVPYSGELGSQSTPRAFIAIAKAATNLDGYILDTSGNNNFNRMFAECSKLTSVPMMDTSQGLNLTYMFYRCSSLTSVPALDVSAGEYFHAIFQDCSSLEQIGIYGFRYEISVANCNLDAKALDAFFTQAGTAYDDSQTINISGNPGAGRCQKYIATAKRWEVIG